jgi:pimeloyl-ACP methyl ester carboxylesterase
MKLFLIIMIAFSFSPIGHADSGSLLDADANLKSFGKIKFRTPKVESSEPPIVLFHGIYGGASHRTWRQLVPGLEAAGKTVYIMDLPGVGESEKPKRAYSLEDIDLFVEEFLETVVQVRSNIVSESILSNSVLRVASQRPDIVRRVIIINPSGINSLVNPPSQREQGLYDRLYANDNAAIAFYQNLLIPNSIKYFLSFSFFDDSLVDDELIADFSVMRDNIDQRFLTLSFVGGQLFRSFEDSSQGVFVPVLGIFGDKYEAFQDNKVSTKADFEAIRPYFDYVEIKDSGSSVQREKPKAVVDEIVKFTILD